MVIDGDMALLQMCRGQVIVCEGEHANLSCPEGRYIAIRLANYGRFTISQCNPTFNTELSTTCQNDKTLGILQQR
ncbi:unnamed protein product [Toxocara canis]|uniref:SUEL-type lectin domain-containing protein n=1 Tax=Toxocara canis TaxID=6265 RepID=A0A183V9B4_TOXCA|nr:unnamed protein product [Toxocara canis]